MAATDEKMLAHQYIYRLNLNKLKGTGLAATKVTQNRHTCWLVNLVCCVTAAQCYKLFFHWAAKHSHWAAFLPSSYNAKRGYEGHTMCGSMADIQSAAAEIRRGKKRRKKKEQITA